MPGSQSSPVPFILERLMAGSSGKKTRYGYSLVSCPGIEKPLWKSCPVSAEKDFWKRCRQERIKAFWKVVILAKNKGLGEETLVTPPNPVSQVLW